jgi:hypothetical protein
MRIAKSLMMISLSVFLLALSWSLLTGQLGAPGPAHAQNPDRFVAIDTYGNISHALTESGGVWKFGTDFSEATYLGQLGDGNDD